MPDPIQTGHTICEMFLASIRVFYPRRRRIFLAFLVFAAACAAVDVACFTSIIPVIYLINDPTPIENNQTLNFIYKMFGFSSEIYFILFLLFCLALVFILKNALLMAMVYVQNKFIFGVAHDITGEQTERFFNARWLDVNGTNSLEYVQYLVDTPQKFATSILMPFLLIYYELVVICLVSAAICWYFPEVLVLVCIAILPVAYLLLRAVRSRLAYIAERKGRMEIDSYQYAHEIIRGYVDIRLFGRERYFKQHIMQKFGDLYRINAQKYLFQLLPRRIIEAVVVLAVATLYAVAAILFKMHPASLVLILITFATAAYRLMPSVNEVLYFLVHIKSSKYILDQLEVLRPVPDKSNMAPLEFKHELQLSGVSYRYSMLSREPVLQSIDLQVPRGAFVVITGESGSGKSTLGKLLAGFLHPDSGSYRIDGQEVRYIEQVRHHIGYVTQDFYLFDRSLLENIAVGEQEAEIDRIRLDAVVRACRLTELVSIFPEGLYYQVGENGVNLSGGQRQRIAIARALYKRAAILILDEITSALDKDNEMEILQAVYDIARAEGLTVFLITHRISSLARYDRHIHISNGRLENLPGNSNN